MIATPRSDARYWVTLTSASVLGTNTGDDAAEVLGVGHLAGLPWLAGLLALVFATQGMTRSASPLFFWAAVIVIRTAATNVGDAFEDRGISFAVSMPLKLAAFAVLARLHAHRSGRTIAVGPLYWATTVAAGVLGTVWGDATSFGLWLLPPGTTAVLGALALAAILLFGRLGLWTVPPAYWTILALVRAAGTGGGDTLNVGLGTLIVAAGGGGDGLPSNELGVGPATILSGATFAALLWAFHVAPQRARRLHLDG